MDSENLKGLVDKYITMVIVYHTKIIGAVEKSTLKKTFISERLNNSYNMDYKTGHNTAIGSKI